MNSFQKTQHRFHALVKKKDLDVRMDDEIRSRIELQT